MVEVLPVETFSHPRTTRKYEGGNSKGEVLFSVWIHYDFSNCGVYNAHYPELSPKGKWEDLFEFLVSGELPEDPDYPIRLSIYRFSGTDFGEVCEFYDWCATNHPAHVDRGQYVTNCNSGNQIFSFNFYTNKALED